MRPLDEKIAGRFRCAKCRNTGANVRRVASTGTGISRFFDVQHNRFIAVSCRHCGFTEFFDPNVLEGKDNLGTILDVLFTS